MLDFVDYPLNNRWWLEDEFAAVRALRRRGGAARPARDDRHVDSTRAPAASTTTSATWRRRRTCCGANAGPETHETGGSDAALHVGRRAEPQAPVVADQPALAQARSSTAPGSRRPVLVRLNVIRPTAPGDVRCVSTAGRRASRAARDRRRLDEFAVPADARERRRHHADLRRHRRERPQLAPILAAGRGLADSAMKMDRRCPPNYKWRVVAMLWGISFFNYADRQAIFSVFPLLEREMQLTRCSSACSDRRSPGSTGSRPRLPAGSSIA